MVEVEEKIKRGRPKKGEPLEIDDIMLYTYLKYNNENNYYECLCCTYFNDYKPNVFRHLKTNHQSEINLKGDEPILAQKYDCEGKICKKTYGYKHKKLWCPLCTEISNMPKKEYTKSNPKRIQRIKEYKLCPDCGKNVKDLKLHINSVHIQLKERCPHCNLEVKYLKEHIKSKHEIVPCTECGAMIGVLHMTRHMQTKHTPDNEMKYKCDVCGKGYHNKTKFLDHQNVHTGAKPYKCKYCSACFASGGNHRMHERAHRGEGRYYNKTKKIT